MRWPLHMNDPIFNRELDIYFDYDIFSDIESREITQFIESLVNINRLPFSQGDIYFNSDTWDFSEYTNTNINKNKRIFRFNQKLCPQSYKNIVKVYTLIKILEDKLKIQSINDLVYKVMIFFKYIDNNFGVYSVQNITDSMITQFLMDKKRNLSVKTLRKYRGAIKDFYKVYSVEFENIRSNKIDMALKHNDFNLVKAAAKQNKSDDIPEEFFNKFVHECMKTSLDPNVEDGIRGTACIYLILSQTGLRIGECLDLRVNALKEIKLFNGYKMNYLFYRTWKRVRREGGVSQSYTYVNEITISAIETLMELKTYKERREKFGNDFLYLGGPNMNSEVQFPIDSESFRKQSNYLFIHLNPDLPTVNLKENFYPGIKNRSVKSYLSGRYSYIKNIAAPTTIQFRVHVCIELSKKGVHPKYIQKFMGHLSSEMTAHYATPKYSFSDQEEEVETARKTLKTIIQGNEKLIGEQSSQFVERIQDFIEKNKFNVAKDVDEIVNSFVKNYPIKLKTGGFFIAPIQIRRSTQDIMSEKYYEKYGFEGTQFTFYYMVDNTYKHIKDLMKIVKHNMTSGFHEVAKKELLKVHRSIHELLEPELEELMNKIDRNGIEGVLREHPNLLEIIENYENIEREILEWKSIEL